MGPRCTFHFWSMVFGRGLTCKESKIEAGGRWCLVQGNDESKFSRARALSRVGRRNSPSIRVGDVCQRAYCASCDLVVQFTCPSFVARGRGVSWFSLSDLRPPRVASFLMLSLAVFTQK